MLSTSVQIGTEVDKLMASETSEALASWIYRLDAHDFVAVKDFCQLFDVSKVAHKIQEDQHIKSIGQIVYGFWRADRVLGEKLWKLLDHKYLATIIHDTASPSDISNFLLLLHNCHFFPDYETWFYYEGKLSLRHQF